MTDREWRKYIRTNTAEMRPYIDGEMLDDSISISQADLTNGSPKIGDMIARNPENHQDQWLVAKDYFLKNFKEIPSTSDPDMDLDGPTDILLKNILRIRK